MNKDKSLKKNELKLIFLVCGNAAVGKKTFVENIIRKLNQQEGLNFDNKSFYISYNFRINHKVDNDVISVPIEIRILNSDERDSELKSNSSFYKGAFGAFVIINEDYKNLQDCSKWKDNIELMCCLPNQFPLPVFLVVNKTLKMEDENFSIGMENIKEMAENYLFFKYYIINLNSIERITKIEEISDQPSKLSTYIVEPDLPFNEMIEVLMNFKDIKEKFLVSYLKKKSLKGQIKGSDKDIDIRSQDKKSCLIL